MTKIKLRYNGSVVEAAKTQGEKYFVILSHYVQPGAGVSAKEAAAEIDYLTPSPRNPLKLSLEDKEPTTDPESSLWDFWGAFDQIAQQLPASDDWQDRLVDLVPVLQELPSTPVTIWGSEIDLWRDLALFGPTLRENWNGPTEQETLSLEKDSQWVNKNAFYARLMAKKIPNVPGLNFPIWVLRDALEENPAASVELRETQVSAAAQWIIYAGPVLYEAIRAYQPDQSLDDITKPGPLFEDGTSGLSVARWAFWKSKFREIDTSAGSQNTKHLSADAVQRMDAIAKEAVSS